MWPQSKSNWGSRSLEKDSEILRRKCPPIERTGAPGSGTRPPLKKNVTPKHLPLGGWTDPYFREICQGSGGGADSPHRVAVAQLREEGEVSPEGGKGNEGKEGTYLRKKKVNKKSSKFGNLTKKVR